LGLQFTPIKISALREPFQEVCNFGASSIPEVTQSVVPRPGKALRNGARPPIAALPDHFHTDAQVMDCERCNASNAGATPAQLKPHSPG